MAGQPTKYKEELNDLAERACSILGADDKKLAAFLQISKATLNKWKKKYPKFKKALKQGKEYFDNHFVKRALWERACGYSHKEEKVFCHQGVITTYITTKHYPPDPTCIIWWQKNRDPDNWKERKAVEESGGDSDNDEGLKDYETWLKEQVK